MSAGAEHINVALIYIDRDLSESLYCICMEQDAMFMCDLTDFLDWLDGSDLIVCKHNRDQDGLRCDGFLKLIQVTDNSILIYIKICDFASSFSRYSHV